MSAPVRPVGGGGCRGSTPEWSIVLYHRIALGTCRRFSSQGYSSRLIMQRDTASHIKQQYYAGACTSPQEQEHIT